MRRKTPSAIVYCHGYCCTLREAPERTMGFAVICSFQLCPKSDVARLRLGNHLHNLSSYINSCMIPVPSGLSETLPRRAAPICRVMVGGFSSPPLIAQVLPPFVVKPKMCS